MPISMPSMNFGATPNKPTSLKTSPLLSNQSTPTPTNPFLANYYRKRGLPVGDNAQQQNGENLVAKNKRWDIASKISKSHGVNTFDAMKLLDMSKMGSAPVKTAFIKGMLGKLNPRKLFSGGKINAPDFVSTGANNAPVNRHWRKLIAETNPNTQSTWRNNLFKTPSNGSFNSMAGSVASPVYRAFGGGLIGGQFDTAENKEKGLFGYGPGTYIGAALAAGSPHALRFFANSSAPKDTISRLLSNGALRSRLMTEPLARTLGGSAVGTLGDSAASALGYDTQGYGQRLGMSLGLAGGLRPTAQLLGGRYQALGNKLTELGKSAPGMAFTNAQKGGFGNISGWAMGSPYVVGSPLVPMAAQVAGDKLVGDRIRSLGEKGKMIRDVINSDKTQPALQQFQSWFKESFPGVPLFDRDGLPSVQAMQIAKQYGIEGLGGLSRMSNNVFADPQYIFNPNNWNRLGRADKIIYDIVNGRYRQAENWLRDLGTPPTE
jgi:hypothetical protein